MLLLAQLVAPPVQPGPVRLPAESIPQERPASQPSILQSPDPDIRPEQEDKNATEDAPNTNNWTPKVNGEVPFPATELTNLLESCRSNTINGTLKACAAALTSKLTSLGYINSRVYVAPEPAPGHLDVVLGKLVQVNINTNEPKLETIASGALKPLVGEVLLLPKLQEALAKLKANRKIGQISGSMGRLGVDPTQAVLTLNIEEAPPESWLGEFGLSNDGNAGTGQYRSINSLLKQDLLTEGDTFLAYLELNGDSDPELGSTITSLSYTYPLGERLNVTGSMGYSRRQLVEAPGSSRELEFRNFQGFAQLSYDLHSSNQQVWSTFAGISISRNDSFLAGNSIPLTLGGGEDGWLRSGYLRLGINGAGRSGNTAWNSNLYALQGLAGVSTQQQLKELNFFGISPGEARALGAVVSTSSSLSPSLGLKLRAAGQVALNELPNSLGFSIGSDVGLKGLPGSLISGDSGWLGTAELSWTFWNNQSNALQLSPFFGVGGVSTTRGAVTFNDTIGSSGVLLRWLSGQHWTVELGWLDQFNDGDNPGLWHDWLLGSGIYADVKYRF